MPTEPKIKRLVAFVDGQALFHASREAFGYTYPNYDVTKIVQVVADLKGWQPVKTYFYTGVPDMVESAVWHGFWSAKLAVMGTKLGSVDESLKILHVEMKEVKSELHHYDNRLIRIEAKLG